MAFLVNDFQMDQQHQQEDYLCHAGIDWYEEGGEKEDTEVNYDYVMSCDGEQKGYNDTYVVSLYCNSNENQRSINRENEDQVDDEYSNSEENAYNYVFEQIGAEGEGDRTYTPLSAEKELHALDQSSVVANTSFRAVNETVRCADFQILEEEGKTCVVSDAQYSVTETGNVLNTVTPMKSSSASPSGQCDTASATVGNKCITINVDRVVKKKRRPHKRRTERRVCQLDPAIEQLVNKEMKKFREIIPSNKKPAVEKTNIGTEKSESRGSPNSPSNVEVVPCIYCSENIQKEDLPKHVTACPSRIFSFSTSSHLQSSVGDGGSCNHCGCKTLTKHAALWHEANTHLMAATCILCGCSLNALSTLRKHLKIVHMKDMEVNKRQKDKDVRQRQFTCARCDFKIDSGRHYNFSRHLQVCYTDLIDSNKCSTCGRSFLSKEALEYHRSSSANKVTDRTHPNIIFLNSFMKDSNFTFRCTNTDDAPAPKRRKSSDLNRLNVLAEKACQKKSKASKSDDDIPSREEASTHTHICSKQPPVTLTDGKGYTVFRNPVQKPATTEGEVQNFVQVDKDAPVIPAKSQTCLDGPSIVSANVSTTDNINPNQQPVIINQSPISALSQFGRVNQALTSTPSQLRPANVSTTDNVNPNQQPVIINQSPISALSQFGSVNQALTSTPQQLRPANVLTTDNVHPNQQPVIINQSQISALSQFGRDNQALTSTPQQLRPANVSTTDNVHPNQQPVIINQSQISALSQFGRDNQALISTPSQLMPANVSTTDNVHPNQQPVIINQSPISALSQFSRDNQALISTPSQLRPANVSTSDNIHPNQQPVFTNQSPISALSQFCRNNQALINKPPQLRPANVSTRNTNQQPVIINQSPIPVISLYSCNNQALIGKPQQLTPFQNGLLSASAFTPNTPTAFIQTPAVNMQTGLVQFPSNIIQQQTCLTRTPVGVNQFILTLPGLQGAPLFQGTPAWQPILGSTIFGSPQTAISTPVIAATPTANPVSALVGNTSNNNCSQIIVLPQ